MSNVVIVGGGAAGMAAAIAAAGIGHEVHLYEKNEKLVMNLFRELNEEGHTIITVTHSDHVGKAAKRIVIIEHGHMREGGEEEKA